MRIIKLHEFLILVFQIEYITLLKILLILIDFNIFVLLLLFIYCYYNLYILWNTNIFINIPFQNKYDVFDILIILQLILIPVTTDILRK